MKSEKTFTCVIAVLKSLFKGYQDLHIEWEQCRVQTNDNNTAGYACNHYQSEEKPWIWKTAQRGVLKHLGEGTEGGRWFNCIIISKLEQNL